MSGILEKILRAKTGEVARRARARPLAKLRGEVEGLPAPRGFADALEEAIGAGRAAVIAEMKKSSPSRGELRADYDPAEIARDYAANGATCLSVLTDAPHFQGDGEHLMAARHACNLPALRKDFLIDPYQIFESRLLGADAVLLIVAALGDPALRELAELAQDLGMDVLVEAHNAAELERALALPCRLIGINNRDLGNFTTRLETTLELRGAVPDDRILVTESGLHMRADVLRMRAANVHAFLVGGAFMRAARPGEKLREMFAE
ncbi:MAG: indole-3-glycerol phosphate synthase TrpC [Gammaproteobacteria bacterium]|nr:indole-3-glycerol phosphate synthase TrpC [Gammaproteobacteria bacterium]